MTCMVFAAWAGHTDASRSMAQDIDRALDMAGIKHTDAAERMGLTLPQLSRQLSGVEPLNLYRLCQLPTEFKLAWLRCHAGRIGASVVTAEEREFILGCARLGLKRMAKCVPEFFQRKAS